jgi:Ca2+-binding RTX toxin-like protein
MKYVIKGTDGDDFFLTGNIRDNIIKGLDGNDFLIGDASAALGFFQAGDDLIKGGDGDDTIVGDVLGGPLTSTVLGGADTLLGGDGDDAISGDGNIGSASGPSQGGDDVLRGGDGNDGFSFSGPFGNDTIQDFTQGEDRISFPFLVEDGIDYQDITDLQIDVICGNTVITSASNGIVGTVTLVDFTGTLTSNDILGKAMTGSTATTGTYDLNLGGSSDTRTWMVGGATLYAIDIAGATTILGDGINDGIDAEVFDHRLPSGPGIAGSEVGPDTFTPETLALADGLGVDKVGDTTYSNLGSASNSGINAGGIDDEEVSDRLGVGLGRETTAGEATLSAFYFRDGTPSDPRGITLAETAVVKVGTDVNHNGVLDAGEIEGSARIVSGGTVESEVGTLDITGAVALTNTGDPLGTSEGNSYNPENAGLFRFTFETTDPWDTIEFSSGGLVRPISGNTSFEADDGDVSDFWLKGLRVNLADDGNDKVWGGKEADSIDGGEGNNRIVGQAGNDTIKGGFGDDKLWGCDGADQIFAGAGNDKVWGGKEADSIDGGEGNDRIIGQAGNDFIKGGFGVDVLSGGKGDDIYAFGTKVGFDPGQGGFSAGVSDTGVGEMADVISNFDGAGESGGDIIDLSVINYFARRVAPSNPEFSFIGTDEFNGDFGQLRYEVRDGYTVIQMDGVRTLSVPLPSSFVGDKMPDAEIIVLGEHDFIANDFIL